MEYLWNQGYSAPGCGSRIFCSEKRYLQQASGGGREEPKAITEFQECTSKGI